MNYTDEEILDLENSLDKIGLSVQTKLGLVEPDNWSSEKKWKYGTHKNFGPFLLQEHGKELYDLGLTPGTSFMLIPEEEKMIGKSIFILNGVSVKATKALEDLYEKYNCNRVFQFDDSPYID